MRETMAGGDGRGPQRGRGICHLAIGACQTVAGSV